MNLGEELLVLAAMLALLDESRYVPESAGTGASLSGG